MTHKAIARTVDAFPGLNDSQRKAAFFKSQQKTDFERFVEFTESIYGKLSQKSYRDLVKFHLDNE